MILEIISHQTIKIIIEHLTTQRIEMSSKTVTFIMNPHHLLIASNLRLIILTIKNKFLITDKKLKLLLLIGAQSLRLWLLLLKKIILKCKKCPIGKLISIIRHQFQICKIAHQLHKFKKIFHISQKCHIGVAITITKDQIEEAILTSKTPIFQLSMKPHRKIQD